jgi:voltage-gated potassium channel Kch
MYDYKPELILVLGMQMTTTGYGDNVPASNLGRFVCVFVMLLGTILVSMILFN